MKLPASIKALGLVFGDIGTSPIYTLSVAFICLPATEANILGILSLIVWTLVLVVTVQYAWLAMSLAEEGKGEGGSIVLRSIILPLLESPKLKIFVTALTFVGLAFFIGDGIITPAISILSAVEGIKFFSPFSGLAQEAIVLIAILITIALFSFQKRGAERVSAAFGPLMFVWFCILGISGIMAILTYPSILVALSPTYALSFMVTHKFAAILLLSKVVLCATGAEALYADMGHLGRRPIINGWLFAFFCLLLVYLGQGAFLLSHPTVSNIFYSMLLAQGSIVYLPLLVLSIIATVIASQAMISGIFSIVYQGVTTNIMPRLRVEYTSQHLMSQIYIPAVNTFMMFFVIITILRFQGSQELANAYGLAVSGSMTITAMLLTLAFIIQKNYGKAFIAGLLIGINALFLFSNLFKISSGGYWSLVIACFPLISIIIYTTGRKRLYEVLRQLPEPQFAEKYTILYERVPHLNGTAVFLAKTIDPMPTYISRTMFTNTIVYEDNVIVAVEIQKQPFGLTTYVEEHESGLRTCEIKAGYLEHINLEKILTSLDIHPKVIFYGVEEISTKNIFWKIFLIIKKLTPSFVQFYKLPVTKLHGVVVKVEM